jgi:(4S)-4-hydroxy-5-phosphonooxypentane-2,3-dione isomerase
MTMVVMIIEVRVKPGMRDKFLEVIRDDAEHSEHDEPGCLRFDVLQDMEDENKFYYYEVYKDEAARLAHRETPHYARYAAANPELLDGDVIRHMTKNVVPDDAGWIR